MAVSCSSLAVGTWQFLLFPQPWMICSYKAQNSLSIKVKSWTWSHVSKAAWRLKVIIRERLRANHIINVWLMMSSVRARTCMPWSVQFRRCCSRICLEHLPICCRLTSWPTLSLAAYSIQQRPARLRPCRFTKKTE